MNHEGVNPIDYSIMEVAILNSGGLPIEKQRSTKNHKNQKLKKLNF
jgi:hypothetical protein